MKHNNSYAVIGILVVLSPLLIIALHNYNRLEQFAMRQSYEVMQFLTTRSATAEEFAASQGGAQQQLMSTHVASEAEVAANFQLNKRQVVHDILKMTEPESFPGPRPGTV